MSEKQPKKKKTAGDVVLTVVLIAAICVFCYAGYNLFHIYTEYKKGTDEYNSITQMAVTERDPDGEAAGPEAGSELKAPMDIDFASLKSVNDDVVGWIYVEAVPDINYPIGVLDDVNIYFQQYATEEEAREKWVERSKRINFQNLFIMFTDRDGCTYQDLCDFEALPYKNKVVFTHRLYPEFDSAYYIRGWEKQECVGMCANYVNKFSWKKYYDQFDYVSWFNQ